jgi:tRNA A-37 threonylcarbamoyl transferase component Bud32
MSTERTFKSGRYRVTGVLGEGAQAETLEALDTESEKHVALKRFLVRGAKSWKDVELAEREARVLAQLSHPKLPRYLDAFEEDGALILVMEKVEGESLAALRKRGGTLDRNEVLRLLDELGQVFEYLHARAPAIIHRDVKPGNVIRKPDGSFALVDFGSVRDSLKPEGGSTVVGTFGYMAPEQFQGRALPQSDVYSLGATALAVLTGRDPEALPHRGLAIDVQAVLGHDRALADLLSRLLDPDPDRRPQRIRPLVAALPRERQHESKAAPRTVPERGPHQHAPHLPGGVIVLIVLLGLAVARFSTAALFRVFLPVLLTVLSLFFGGALRRTAKQMRDVGERGEEGLRKAREAVIGATSRHDRRRRRRQRVIDTEGKSIDEEVRRKWQAKGKSIVEEVRREWEAERESISEELRREWQEEWDREADDERRGKRRR